MQMSISCGVNKLCYIKTMQSCLATERKALLIDTVTGIHPRNITSGKGRQTQKYFILYGLIYMQFLEKVKV